MLLCKLFIQPLKNILKINSNSFKKRPSDFTFRPVIVFLFLLKIFIIIDFMSVFGFGSSFLFSTFRSHFLFYKHNFWRASLHDIWRHEFLFCNLFFDFLTVFFVIGYCFVYFWPTGDRFGPKYIVFGMQGLHDMTTGRNRIFWKLWLFPIL